jgi:hypothetical protein
MARFPVALGRVIAPHLRFSCQAGRLPISGARREFGLMPAFFRFAAIAQLVEHVIRNDGVGGSNPSCGTSLIYLKNLPIFDCRN